MLPEGYDHKYVYSHFGYNLKATDMQAAVGCAQLKKLEHFTRRRRENWNDLHEKMSDLGKWLVLPEAESASKPSWFGYAITVREQAGFSRNELTQFLEGKNIQTRNVFAGNIVKHPCFDEMRRSGAGYRVAGDLTNTDRIMSQTFWVGVYPGMTKEKLGYMAGSIREFVENRDGK